MEFKKVKCNSFLKKINDGKFMNVIKSGEVEFLDSNDENFSLISECCGDNEFLKTYYEVKRRNFNGIIVGYKDIVLNGWLCASTEYDFYDKEFTKLYKNPNKIIKCAIVYYASNKKSYVPLNDITESEDISCK